MKCKITVYDHRSTSCGPPIKLEVDAWCVGGDTGIIAYFVQDGLVHEAHGDDGNWWLVGAIDWKWLEELQRVVSSVEVSKKDKRRKHR